VARLAHAPLGAALSQLGYLRAACLRWAGLGVSEARFTVALRYSDFDSRDVWETTLHYRRTNSREMWVCEEEHGIAQVTGLLPWRWKSRLRSLVARR
jgi:hypothetical protein